MGKTTCAALFAVSAARQSRTLLVTTDPASSLSAVLNVAVGSAAAAVRGIRGLDAASIDAASAFERWLAPRKALLSTIAVRGTYLDEEDVARLLKLSLPGIDEVIGLLEIFKMTGDAQLPYGRVIVDTAPTGHTLRLLAAPLLLGRVAALLDSLQSHHRAVVSALRGSYRADPADALIVELDRDADALNALLRDRTASDLTWVTLPEPMALEETLDGVEALRARGLDVGRLIVNRLTAAPPQPCAWCDARRQFEARALAPVARRFAGREMLALPDLEDEPRGAAALRQAASLLAPWQPPATAAPLPRRLTSNSLPGLGPRMAAAPARKLLLFGGKGGVGKTTCAAAEAVRLAADARVLLVSTDPAHSLGDVFGTRFDNTPRPAAGVPHLHVREIDAAAEMQVFRHKYLAAVDDAFARVARAAGGEQNTFRELIDLAPPGIDEVMAVAGVADALTAPAPTDTRYDVVVADTAPTGHALRLLQTPAVLRDWTLALMAILLKYREIVGAGTLATLLVQLSKRLRALQDILIDPSACGFVVVTRPARVPAGEAVSLIDSLRSMHIAVDAVIVNAAGAGDCSRCRGGVRRQEQIAAGLRPRQSAYAIIVTPAEIPPPHGPAALREWGRSWRQLQ